MRKGFTFIEVLVTTAIISLIGLAVYSVFANGINAWRRGTIDRTYLRNIRLGSEKMARDLKNTFSFSNIAFEGTEDSLSFPALVLVGSESNNREEIESHYEVGRIAYFYDRKANSLRKEEKTYQQLFEEEEIGEGDALVERTAITGLSSLKFSYCYLDNATDRYGWKDDWKREEQDTIPQAIKIEMSFEDDFIKEGEFNRIIFIPIGTGKQEITFE